MINDHLFIPFTTMIITNAIRQYVERLSQKTSGGKEEHKTNALESSIVKRKTTNRRTQIHMPWTCIFDAYDILNAFCVRQQETIVAHYF